jgi:hypothetical protein
MNGVIGHQTLNRKEVVTEYDFRDIQIHGLVERHGDFNISPEVSNQAY